MKIITATRIYQVLAVWISFVFIQSGFFKFTNAPETQHIFSTVGQWMSETINPALGNIMTHSGGYFIGGVEYAASVFLLLPVFHQLIGKNCRCNNIKTFIGAVISFGVITGALFFHLFTPLGIEVKGDGGALFAMAVSVWIASGVLIYAHKNSICKC